MSFLATGVWYEGGVGAFRDNLIPEDVGTAKALFERNFADLAAHGVNSLVAPNLSPSHHRVLLDAAHAHGLRCIIELDHEGSVGGAMIRGKRPFDAAALLADFDQKLGPILKHPALWQVQIIDEPPPGSFDRYQQVAEALRQYVRPVRPEIRPFSCLIGADSFESFLTKTGSDIAAFDFYPLRPKTPPGDRGALDAVAAQSAKASALCRAHRAEAWAVLQAHELPGSLRFPTPEELRCMTWLALAGGCKAVWWFYYQTEWLNKARGLKMTGLVDSDYHGGANWAEISRLSRDIARIAPILTTLTPVSGDPLWDKANQPVTLWKDDRKRLHIFAVNRDTNAARPVEMRLRPGAIQRARFLRLPSGYAPATHREGEQIIATDLLAPGAGALYRCEV